LFSSYLLSLNYIDLIGEEFGRTWSPYGQFSWRRPNFNSKYTSLLGDLVQEANEQQNNWKVLDSHMFNGDFENFKRAQTKLDEFLKLIHF